jgi:hypothetical protein
VGAARFHLTGGKQAWQVLWPKLQGKNGLPGQAVLGSRLLGHNCSGGGQGRVLGAEDSH